MSDAEYAALVGAAGSGGVDQARCGSRGFISGAHYFEKQPEFLAWLSEVRGIPQDAPVPKGELMAYFSDFCEDWNTATLPHDKYYDLAKWERESAAASAAAGPRGGGGGDGGLAGALDLRAAADQRKREAAEAARKKDAERLALYRSSMDASRLRELADREQTLLAMQYAFKKGDKAEAERLQRILDPEAAAKR